MTPVAKPVENPESDRDLTDPVRVRLLDAALALLQADEPLTVRAIAERADCSTMLVYSRFGGKAGVFDALLVDGFNKLRVSVERCRATKDPVGDLRSCARAYRRFALEHPTLYLVMFERTVDDYEPGPDAVQAAADSIAVLQRRVQRAIDHGGVRGTASDVAATIWALNHGMVSLEIHKICPPGIDWAKAHPRAIEMMLKGLVAP